MSSNSEEQPKSPPNSQKLEDEEDEEVEDEEEDDEEVDPFEATFDRMRGFMPLTATCLMAANSGVAPPLNPRLMSAAVISDILVPQIFPDAQNQGCTLM